MGGHTKMDMPQEIPVRGMNGLKYGVLYGRF